MSKPFCQANTQFANAGAAILDRSQFIPWATESIMDPNPNNKSTTVPREWANLGDQAAFAVSSDGNANLFFDSNLGVSLDNGHGTWRRDETPIVPSVPALNSDPASSTAYWMRSSCDVFQDQDRPYCVNGSVVQKNGFVALCNSGSRPTCDKSGGVIQCDGSAVDGSSHVAMYVNEKYAGAVARGHLPNQKTTPFSPQNMVYDLVDCNGAPCMCLNGDGTPVAGAPAMCKGNGANVQGIYGFPAQSCPSGTMSTPVPTFRGTLQSGTLIPSQTPICSDGLVAACKSGNLGAAVQPDPSKVLYGVCPETSLTGDTYNVPLLCSSGDAAQYQSGSFVCQSGGPAVTCPGGSQPVAIVASKCSDGSQPYCVTEPKCPSTGRAPTAPVGYNLVQAFPDKSWQTFAYNPDSKNTASPICSYFGVKEVDMCACNCIVDSSGAPIAEGVPVIQDGQAKCLDPNTELNATQWTKALQCVRGGTVMDVVPTCADGSRAYYDPVKDSAACANGSAPSCSVGDVQMTGIVSLDPFPGTNTPSLRPVMCVSTLSQGLCAQYASKEPIQQGDGTLVCPENFKMQCPGAQGSITVDTQCAGGTQKPYCTPSNTVCTDVYQMSDFGKQALASPTDDLLLSNYGTVFCSSSDSSPASCKTVLQSYFPSLQPPLGSGDPAKPSALLVPDPMTAGVLAQGICLSANKTIPNQVNEFTCASSTNPATALQTWNQQGAATMSLVPVGAPFPLKQSNGKYPTESYFESQVGAGNQYDRGLNYYMEQTCIADSSGACKASQVAGLIQFEAGHVAACPLERDELVISQVSQDKVTPFDVQCSQSGVKPHILREEPRWPTGSSGECGDGHKMVCADLNDAPAWNHSTGVFECPRTLKAAVCVPTPDANGTCASGARVRADHEGAQVCDPLASLQAAVPVRACMNQINPSLGNGVEWPGQGPVADLFEYDPIQGTCVQKAVCPSGVCDTNIRADSVMQYHQGITLMQYPQYPAIFQSDETFPASMFGDLGEPGNGQIFTPQLKNIQPVAANTAQNGNIVPQGFLYWQQSANNSAKQGSSKDAQAAQVIFNDVVWIPIPFALAPAGFVVVPIQTKTQSYQAENYKFDTTGAGYDVSQYVKSSGNTTKDLYETQFAPTVTGPLMSGPMAYGPKGKGSTFQSFSVGKLTSDNDNAQQNYTQASPLYPYKMFGANSIPQDPSTVSTRGFNSCETCNYFFCQTAEAMGGACTDVSSIAPFTLGNEPNQPKTSDACQVTDKSTSMYTPIASNCLVANWDSCSGRGAGCSANLQCRCTCDGNTPVDLVKYTFTVTNENTCDNFCTESFCRENAPGCSDAKSVHTFCINSDQIPF